MSTAYNTCDLDRAAAVEEGKVNVRVINGL